MRIEYTVIDGCVPARLSYSTTMRPELGNFSPSCSWHASPEQNIRPPLYAWDGNAVPIISSSKSPALERASVNSSIEPTSGRICKQMHYERRENSRNLIDVLGKLPLTK